MSQCETNRLENILHLAEFALILPDDWALIFFLRFKNMMASGKGSLAHSDTFTFVNHEMQF